jgi:uncharacterized protein
VPGENEKENEWRVATGSAKKADECLAKITFYEAVTMKAIEIIGTQLRLRIYTQPKASRDEIVGLHGDELKVAITAPPVDGKANAHIIKFMAKEFGVAKSKIKIIKGELSRHKVIEIESASKIPGILLPYMTD